MMRPGSAPIYVRRWPRISASSRIPPRDMRTNCRSRARAMVEAFTIVPAITVAERPLAHEPEIVMATLKKKIEDPSEITNPNVVKVVTGHAGDAIYFSRSPIPFDRDRTGDIPYFTSHSRNSGSVAASTTAWLSSFSTSSGMPLGAARACQVLTTKSG